MKIQKYTMRRWEIMKSRAEEENGLSQAEVTFFFVKPTSVLATVSPTSSATVD